MALFPIDEPRGDERVLLHNVSWAGYLSMRESLGHNVRLTYLRGRLEIMTVGHVHEVTRKMLGRLLELFCLERDIPLFAYGHETKKRRADELGLEPDEWYSRGPAGRVPAIAIEVIVTNPLLDKLAVYAGLGVREVLPRITHYAMQEDQHAALVALRTELRKS